MGLVDKNGTIITPVGGVASAALPAAVDAGQPVRAYFDQNGRLHVVSDSEGADTIASVTADKLQYNGTPSEDVTCTVAGQDYATVGAVPAGTKYVSVYCPNACIVAMGQVTAMACAAPLFDPAIFDPAIFQNAATGAVGRWIGAGQPTDLPVAAADVTAGLHPHVQCPTAGSVVRFTYATD